MGKFARGVLIGVGALVLGCSDEGVCTDIAIASGAAVSASFGDCWDGQDREVECVATAGGGQQCTCSVGGNTGQTFERTEPLTLAVPPSDADLAPINAGCGWSLKAR